jgi:hypothetical protein
MAETKACVFKTGMSLVCLTDMELGDSGDIEEQLEEIDSVEQTVNHHW